jgi:transcriptional regulator with XRE-family HTH domain
LRILVDRISDFVDLVRAERQGKGVSQAHMADDIGVSRRWIIQFKAGKVPNPGFNTVLRILAYLDLRIDVQKKKSEVTLYPADRGKNRSP